MNLITLLIGLFFISLNSNCQTLNVNGTMKPVLKYGMTGKMKAKDGKGDELAAILLEASRIVSTAKGLGLYIISKDMADANVVIVMEAWESKEDHDNSLKLPGVKELIGKAMPLIEGKPEGSALAILGGYGAE